MIKEIRYSEFVEEVPVVREVIDSSGREVLSKTPVSIPIQLPAAPASMFELVHRLYAEMNNKEFETFEDADDFDVPDELGIEMRNTPYEQDFDHVAEGSAAPAGSSPVPPEPEKVEPEKVAE